MNSYWLRFIPFEVHYLNLMTYQGVKTMFGAKGLIIFYCYYLYIK